MKLTYKKKFDGDPNSLPHGEHKPNAVKFKEFDDPKKLAIFANGLSIVIMIVFAIPVFLRWGFFESTIIGAVLPVLTLFPHEILHGICFKDEVYLYTNWAQGMLFVVGPEEMSRKRFIFMSLLPNIVFGLIPYLLSFLTIKLAFLGVSGALCIAMGAGDYYNVFNALTQMPKGARTYLHKFNSYWFMPEV